MNSCRDCRIPSVLLRCPKCNQKRADYRQSRVALGLCRSCHKPRGERGTTSACRPCADKANASYKARGAGRRRRFNISPEAVRAMERDQNGLCAICQSAPTGHFPLIVDHCHATGRLRRLLCNMCNQGLGRFKDQPRLLREAATYLESFAA